MIQKPCTNLNHKCNLLRRTLQVKNSKISYKKLHRKISVFESLGLQIYKKETSIQVFSCQIYKISKNTFFLKLQWLLPRFDSCFQSSPRQKPMRLSPIQTRFSSKRYLPPQKSRSSYRQCSVKEVL